MKELNSIMKKIHNNMLKEQRQVKKSLNEGKIYLTMPEHSYLKEPAFSVDGDIYSKDPNKYRYKLTKEEVKRYRELREEQKQLSDKWKKLKIDILQRCIQNV